jgi:hypothetical protein
MRRHLSYSNVIASIALIFALSGVAYAATQLPKNSVGTKQLKKDSVNSNKVKAGTLLSSDFKSGQIPAGAKGDTGPQGPQGVPGTAKAGAVVSSTGTTSAVFGGLEAFRAGEGEYCISLPGQPISALANIQVTTDYSQSGSTFWSPASEQFTIAGVVANNNVCPSASTREIRVYQVDVDTAPYMAFDDAPFRVIVP